MASISNDPNGRRRVQFVDSDGKRKTIRLGKVSHRAAEAIKVKVEDLLSATITGHTPRDDTSRWAANLDDSLHKKLANVGLVQQRGSATLGGFIDQYIDRRSDVKASTQTVYERVKRYLVDYFGSDRDLRTITPGDADAWRLDLISQGKADNTIRRSCGVAKQFFTAAVRAQLITSNPFVDLVAAVKAVHDRFYFVTQKEAAAVLDACPDTEWRLLFALARFGGLRVPSEVRLLRWADIDWERGRIRVPSPKTEHHEDGAERIIPLFPELRSHLLNAFEHAEEGGEWCIARYRDPSVNLRTQLQKIIRRAGLVPWPKLWQNLRSTRETELADEFPIHVVCKWIGNSQPVAARHYLQLTDEHFERAAGCAAHPKAAQKAAQKAHETTGNELNDLQEQDAKTPANTGVFTSFREVADSLRIEQVGDTGLEPVTSRV